MRFETTDAGKGYSSPPQKKIVGDRIYLTDMNGDENDEKLNCYTIDGKKLHSRVWKTLG